MFVIISVLLSTNILSYYFISRKSSHVLKSKFILSPRINFLEMYREHISKTLENLGNPYKITPYKYIAIKYLLSLLVLFVIYIRNNNLFVALIFFIIFFLLPNFLIYSYKKSENSKIISEITNVVQNIILSLSANMSFYESLKISSKVISYNRFRVEYEKFTENYMVYNFNILKATDEFQKKFNSYEFNMFMSILIESEKEGNLLENMEAFNESLELVYFKCLKQKAAQRMVIIAFATIISLINIFAIVMYPMAIQISNNLIEIFK